MKKHGKKTEPFDIVIEKLVYGGSGFARHEGKVIFVPFSAPGDRLSVRPVEEKKSFVRAEIIRILKPSKGRVTPVCPHFKRCGGCQLQHMEYRNQVEAKRQILAEAFYHRFPETQKFQIAMRACPQPLAYRSRARIQLRGAGEKALVGFFRLGSHAVEDVEHCPLFRKSLNEALSSLRQFKRKVETETKPQEMDIACSEEEDSWATALSGRSELDYGGTTLLGTRRTEDVLLKRKVDDFTYLVTASVFFQANDFMISALVALIKRLTKTAKSASALDLYGGVGLFSLPLARQYAQVVSVENSPSASRLCQRNANAAGLGNVRSECADVAAWLGSRGETEIRAFDTLVLDPPRAGAGKEIMLQISKLAPKSILYVSCDPLTLIRDLTVIAPHDYAIRSVEGLDMFPQTYHFETVVHLEKN